MSDTQDLLTQIAREHLGIETLAPQNHDGLDFFEVGVVGVQQALQAAYAAGRATQRPDDVLAAAESLLAAKDCQVETALEWRRLRRAIRQARKNA